MKKPLSDESKNLSSFSLKRPELLKFRRERSPEMYRYIIHESEEAHSTSFRALQTLSGAQKMLFSNILLQREAREMKNIAKFARENRNKDSIRSYL